MSSPTLRKACADRRGCDKEYSLPRNSFSKNASNSGRSASAWRRNGSQQAVVNEKFHLLAIESNFPAKARFCFQALASGQAPRASPAATGPDCCR